MVEKIDANLSLPSISRPIEGGAAGTADQKPDPASVKATVAAAPTYDIQVRVDKKTSEATVILINPETGTVIREIPGKEMHAASDVIRSLIGPLIDKSV